MVWVHRSSSMRRPGRGQRSCMQQVSASRRACPARFGSCRVALPNWVRGVRGRALVSSRLRARLRRTPRPCGYQRGPGQRVRPMRAGPPVLIRTAKDGHRDLDQPPCATALRRDFLTRPHDVMRSVVVVVIGSPRVRSRARNITRIAVYVKRSIDAAP